MLTGLGNGCSYVTKKKLKEVLTEVLFPEGHSHSNMEEVRVSIAVVFLNSNLMYIIL